MSSTSRTTVLAAVEQLAFNLEDITGTVRSILTSEGELTLTERQWLAYLEDTLVQWHQRLNRVDMFQPSLWDGHRD